MKLIGITGGIGAGKSTVAQIFSTLEIPVYDSDSKAKWLMQHNEVLIAELKKIFGENTYTADHQVNRTYLAKEIFNDQSKRERMNALVHPVVKQDFKGWIQQQVNVPYCIYESALLIETGSYTEVDEVIVVSAPEEIRCERLLKRDSHRNEKDIRAIIKAQLSDDERISKASYVLLNDDQNLLLPEVIELHYKFCK